MNATVKRTSTLAAAVAAASMFLFPTTAQGATPEIMAAIRSAQIPVSRLNVVETDGITIVRGQVTRREYANRVAEVVRGLGYSRVANMLNIVPLREDEALVLEAERQLSLTRSLDGCRLSIDASEGVVFVRGTVDSELQKDLAISVLERIDGVKAVRSTLSRS
jgi:osmotically-inducible protein OsmY